MSKWQNLLSVELTPPEKQYLAEKLQDGMRETGHGHLCFVGRSISKVMCTYLQKDEKIEKKKKIQFQVFLAIFAVSTKCKWGSEAFLRNESIKLAYHA